MDMAKKGSDGSRPSSRVLAKTPFEIEFPGGSESANAAIIELVVTHQAVIDVQNEMLREMGVSQAGRQLLAVIEGAGEGLSPTAIADRMMLTTASITSLLDTLEARKFVKRAADPSDRRKILVAITPAGRKLVDRFLPEVVALQTEMMRGISEADRKKLVATLRTLKANAHAIDAAAVRKTAAPRGNPRHG